MKDFAVDNLDIPEREEGERDITDNQLEHLCDIANELGKPERRDYFSTLGITQARVLLDQLTEIQDDVLKNKAMGLHKPKSPESDKTGGLVLLALALLSLVVIVI